MTPYSSALKLFDAGLAAEDVIKRLMAMGVDDESARLATHAAWGKVEDTRFAPSSRAESSSRAAPATPVAVVGDKPGWARLPLVFLKLNVALFALPLIAGAAIFAVAPALRLILIPFSILYALAIGIDGLLATIAFGFARRRRRVARPLATFAWTVTVLKAVALQLDSGFSGLLTGYAAVAAAMTVFIWRARDARTYFDR